MAADGCTGSLGRRPRMDREDEGDADAGKVSGSGKKKGTRDGHDCRRHGWMAQNARRSTWSVVFVGLPLMGVNDA